MLSKSLSTADTQCKGEYTNCCNRCCLFLRGATMFITGWDGQRGRNSLHKKFFSDLFAFAVWHHKTRSYRCLNNSTFAHSDSLIFVLSLFCQQGNIYVRVVYSRMPVPVSTRKLPEVFHAGERNNPWKSKANSAETTSLLGPMLVSIWYDTSYSRNWDCGNPGEIEIILMFEV